MHRVGDSGIIDRAGNTEDFWLADLNQLDTAENRTAWMASTVEDWATESLSAAREAYLIPGTDKRLRSGQKLGEEYQAKHLPIVHRRLCQPRLRLSSVDTVHNSGGTVFAPDGEFKDRWPVAGRCSEPTSQLGAPGVPRNPAFGQNGRHQGGSPRPRRSPYPNRPSPCSGSGSMASG